MRSIVLLISLVAAGCASAQQGAPARRMALDFTWQGIQRCTNISPEIRLADYPAQTRRFRVQLVDLDVMMGDQGGGEVANDGTGIIAKGALKSYTGPCPPGAAHRYQMRVAALGPDGTVLAEARETRIFPPDGAGRSTQPQQPGMPRKR